MSKIVSVRLSDRVYGRFRKLAKQDNRPLSNFIETAALRYIDSLEYDEESIQSSGALNKSLKRGLRDARAKRGHIV